MIALEHLLLFIQDAEAQQTLKPLHISLYMAIYSSWVHGQCKNPIITSRKELMKIAKIESIATYHKGIHDLCSFNYIQYEPSYDPRTRTKIYLTEIKRGSDEPL